MNWKNEEKLKKDIHEGMEMEKLALEIIKGNYRIDGYEVSREPNYMMDDGWRYSSYGNVTEYEITIMLSSGAEITISRTKKGRF